MDLSRTTQPIKRARKTPLSVDLLIFGLAVLIVILLGRYLGSPSAGPMRAALDWVFSLTSDQVMWYLTRAAGMIAYLLLWFSTVWGLAIPSKLFGEVLSGDFTFDFHKFISLLSLGFLCLHVFVLTADHFLPYSIAQILVPFLSPYRPVWVGIGVIAAYLSLLVTVTFYLRKQIGMKAFRVIHYTSLVAYLGAVAHSLLSGTDSSLPVILFLYVGTFAVVIFLTVYWLIRAWVNRPIRIPEAKILSKNHARQS